MNKLKAILSFLVLGTWLSCTVHCQLAMAGVLQSHKAFALDAPDSSAPDSDEDSVCSWMDSGGCEVADCTITVDIPVLERPLDDLAWTLFILKNGMSRVSSGGDEPIPPELPQSWQFSSRAALPVRAPSFAS